MAYTEQEKEQWLEIAQDTGESLERTVPILPLNEMDKTVSIPGVVFPNIIIDETTGEVTSLGKPSGYAQLPLGTLVIKTRAADEAAQRAEAAADAAEGAENVDATLVGMTVTITDRQGVSRSTNIGFDIYRTYSSVNAMKADAANVPEGKFVMIATTNPTDPDNAQLWGRNDEPATSQNPFTFLSDLDQASSAAWADWLNNMKPEIIAAINAANTAADRVDAVIIVANSDHTRAESDHTTATTDHSTAVTDHSTAVQDHTTAQSDHTTASSDHTIASADHTQAMTDTGVAAQDHTTAVQDHSTATQDHSTASSDHTQATQDHTASTQATADAIEQAEILEEWNTHQPYIGDGTTGDANYWYIWDSENDVYVRSVYAKGDDLHWDEMTEAEKEALAQRVLEQLVFASVQTCEDIIDELT